MTIASRVRAGRWADSARLLQAARAAEGAEGVERAACFMATPANAEEARGMGLWEAGMDAAGPNDAVLVAEGSDPGAGLDAAAAVLDGTAAAGGDGAAAARAPRRLNGLDADLALISVPGEYAAVEAHKALGAGMDVMLFSDGVAEADEVSLKRRAHALGRLVMGPGAGTAIIDGVGIGFANVVARGTVGVVAAAGTGAQEVTVLVDRAGAGVSRCYGTGGRDLYESVGAITARDAIARLAADEDTAVILCVSKPPAPAVAQRVLVALVEAGKPAVACFVGAEVEPHPGVEVVATLEEAAASAARRAGAHGAVAGVLASDDADWSSRGVVRGLFSGGTLCSEAAAILAGALGDVASNAPAGRARRLEPGEAPAGHVCIDMGEEEFTRGRPHPMIDPQARVDALAEAAGDHDVGVVLLDVVLGFASHPDPAGALAPAIAAALADRPALTVIAYVLGSDGDAQGLEAQRRTLADAGARLAPTNAAAARMAAAMLAARGWGGRGDGA